MAGLTVNSVKAGPSGYPPNDPRAYVPAGAAPGLGMTSNPNYKYQPAAPGGIGGGYVPKSKEDTLKDHTLDAQLAQADAVKGLYGAMGGGGGAMPFGMGGSASGSVSGSGTPGSVAPGAQIAMPDMTAANNAAYASAKDKVGNQARGALTSLNDELGADGMLGSGAQAQGTRDVINAGQGQLGEVARGQAENQANLAADFAKTGYQGAITQRGQDINAQEANARLALESRQQYMQMLAAAMGGLKGSMGGSGSDSTPVY